MSNQSRPSQDDWDAHWDHYAESAAENPAQRMRHEIIARLLCEDAGKGTMQLFDLGSGQGDLVQKLEPLLPNARFVGAELSESGVAISRKKVPAATFLVADIFQPPAALNEFTNWATHAVCSEVLEHVDDPVAFLKRARDYLAAGARLIVTVPDGPCRPLTGISDIGNISIAAKFVRCSRRRATRWSGRTWPASRSSTCTGY